MACKVEGCEGRVQGQGWCGMHYARVKRHGDPFYVRTANRCRIDGCERDAKATKELCMLHYLRIRNTGSPGMAVARLSVEERFWLKVRQDDETGCWIWPHLNSYGYGHFSIDGKHASAHRYAYQLLVGPIPVGLELDHLCRVPACCNPGHLEPVTPRENKMRGIGVGARNARKTHCLRGHPLSGDNLKIDGYGRRICRTCASMHRHNRYLRLGK